MFERIKFPRAVAVAALVAAAGITIVAVREASAQEAGGGFVGVPPAEAGTAFLTTTEGTTASALMATLTDAGCEVESIAAHSQQGWRVNIQGAPAQVNAPFPATIAAGTPFFVRCRDSATPAIDPANATYHIESDDVTLVDGRSEVPVAPGSATKTVTILTERRSYGDLDGAGASDAGVVLVQDPGGSGTFYYLAGLRAGAGGAAPTVFLGDRIVVDGVSVAHGRLTVAYLERRPDDPFAATPTVPVTRTFVLVDGALVEIGSGACEVPGLDQIGPFVFVTAPHSGARVHSGFAVTGCSRTFESTVNWRLLDRAGDEIASGFTSGGGFDGPGRFAFAVEYSLSEEQLGHLEVFEVDVSGGEGFPPPRNVIPLVLVP
jgi:hypothetical protein